MPPGTTPGTAPQTAPQPRPPAAELDAAALARLDEITRRLRRECPWDREQDERSIVPHTVEEAYELADAAAAGDDAKLRDELGDVLFQVVFLSLLLEERGEGSLGEVADQLTEKLIRRHPHVFGDTPRWRRPATSCVNGTRSSAMSRAGEPRTRSRTSRRTCPGCCTRARSLRRAEPDGGGTAARETRDEAEAAVGEMLLEAVRLSRRLGVDPELAVRAAADRLRDRARARRTG